MTTEKKRYTNYFRPEIVDGRVVRCEGSTGAFETPELADAEAKKDGRPYVVGDDLTGQVHVPEPAKHGRR